MKNLNEILNSIREETPEAATVAEAGERIRGALFGAAAGVANVSGRIQTCQDYRSLIPSYVSKAISDARRMLLEDHVGECIPCRRAFDEARQGGLGVGTGAKPVVIPMTRPKGAAPAYRRWAIAAAMLISAGGAAWFTLRPFGGSGEPVGTVESIDGMLYRVADSGTYPVAQGRQLSEGEEIRAARGTRAIVRLFDGSLIEMNERADVSVDRGFKGTTIHLSRGNIIVQAAKQKTGKLFVASGESLVSVKGTIFTVSRGTRGTRVSVVEGAVAVDQRGRSKMLKPGEQSTSDPSLGQTTVESEVAWSRDAARYVALLGELHQLGQKIDAIPSPALRYQSNLLAHIPADTMIYAAIPNAGQQLGEARQVFEEQTRTNPVLREWWTSQQKGAAPILAGLDKLQTLSGYLGAEAVLAVRPDHSFAVIAETTSPSQLDAFLSRELQGGPGLSRSVRGNTMILASSVVTQAMVERAVDAPAAVASPFRDRVAEAYRKGAGWLLAMDVRRMGIKADANAVQFGVDNLDTVVLERREVQSKTETTATLNFGEQRRGVASWLGAPGPVSTLEFVSPDAGAAFAVLTRNPRQVVDELLSSIRKNRPGLDRDLADLESKLGVKLVDDLAGPLGSEFTIAQDGPLLPDLSWKVAVEVNAPQTLQYAIEKLVAAAGREGNVQLRLDQKTVDHRMYYTLSGASLPMAVHYTFTDGYLLIAPAESLLTQAIENRRNGYTLPRSEKFRSMLPYGKSLDFSALVYQNISQITRPVTEQLSKLNVMTKEQATAASELQNMTPGLIYVYGERDRIAISSAGGFFGMNLGVLSGLDRGLPFLIPGAGLRAPRPAQ